VFWKFVNLWQWTNSSHTKIWYRVRVAYVWCITNLNSVSYLMALYQFQKLCSMKWEYNFSRWGVKKCNCGQYQHYSMEGLAKPSKTIWENSLYLNWVPLKYWLRLVHIIKAFSCWCVLIHKDMHMLTLTYLHVIKRLPVQHPLLILCGDVTVWLSPFPLK
jgi:hypothetical protein